MTEQAEGADRPMTEQARHPYIDSWDRNLCDTCDEWQGAKAHRTEQARETPEPLTPEPYDDAALDYWRKQLARDRVEYPEWNDAQVLIVVGRFLATVDALRAAPDPAEPTCCELACYEDPGCACDGCTPDPAEPGLQS
jgi:hypothetical protein